MRQDSNMKLQYLTLVALVVAYFVALSAADCNVSLKQTKVTSWQQEGQDYSQWNGELLAEGSDDVASLQLSLADSSHLLNIWELKKDLTSSGLYNLPAWRTMNQGLPAGETHRFGYIIKSADAADFQVASVQCKSDSTETPTPTPSSPVVSTPQPPAQPCSLTVSQTKRSSAEGGSWVSGDFGFQIYDLQLTNNGQNPATAARLSLNLNADAQQQVYQFWNVERVSADSTEFNVPTPWGPIQPGASQGAGYIVRYPTSAAGQQADPTVTVLSSTCDDESGSPATPSPIPTIVATPQPGTGCSATVSVTARPTDKSGSWTGNGAYFQIFDLVIANAGSRAVTGADLTFALPQGSSVFQWWELNERVGSNTQYDVSFQYGPLQVGATQGAGIVVKSAEASQTLPGVTLGSVTCN